MKRKFVFGLGIAALMASAPFVVSKPVLANLQEFGAAIAQQITQSEVKLVMSAEKQITVLDENGEPQSRLGSAKRRSSCTA